MSVYVVGNYTIHNEDMYFCYVERVRSTLVQYRGKTIVAEHAPIVLEGEPRQVITIVEFHSLEQAQKWYNSQEYQEIIHYRKESSYGFVTICKEFVIPATPEEALC